MEEIQRMLATMSSEMKSGFSSVEAKIDATQALVDAASNSILSLMDWKSDIEHPVSLSALETPPQRPSGAALTPANQPITMDASAQGDNSESDYPGASPFIPDDSLEVGINIVTSTPTRCSTEVPSRGVSELRSPSDSARSPTVIVDPILLAATTTGNGTPNGQAISGVATTPATCSMDCLPRQPVGVPVLVASPPPIPVECILDTNTIQVAAVPLVVMGETPAVLAPRDSTHVIQIQQLYKDSEFFMPTSGQLTASKVPRPMPWPSFLGVHADGVESRPWPWPSFGEIGCEFTSNSVEKALRLRISDSSHVKEPEHYFCTCQLRESPILNSMRWSVSSHDQFSCASQYASYWPGYFATGSQMNRVLTTARRCLHWLACANCYASCWPGYSFTGVLKQGVIKVSVLKLCWSSAPPSFLMENFSVEGIGSPESSGSFVMPSTVETILFCNDTEGYDMCVPSNKLLQHDKVQKQPWPHSLSLFEYNQEGVLSVRPQSCTVSWLLASRLLAVCRKISGSGDQLSIHEPSGKYCFSALFSLDLHRVIPLNGSGISSNVGLLSICGKLHGIGRHWQGSIHTEVTFWLEYSFNRIDKMPHTRQSPHDHCSTGLQIGISVPKYFLCQLFLVRAPLIYLFEKQRLPTRPRSTAYCSLTGNMFSDLDVSVLVICETRLLNHQEMMQMLIGCPPSVHIKIITNELSCEDNESRCCLGCCIGGPVRFLFLAFDNLTMEALITWSITSIYGFNTTVIQWSNGTLGSERVCYIHVRNFCLMSLLGLLGSAYYSHLDRTCESDWKQNCGEFSQSDHSENHAHEDLSQLELDGVVSFLSFFQGQGLARYQCTTCALAPNMQILFGILLTYVQQYLGRMFSNILGGCLPSSIADSDILSIESLPVATIVIFSVPVDCNDKANQKGKTLYDPGSCMLALFGCQKWWNTSESTLVQCSDQLQWFSRIWFVAWAENDTKLSSCCGQALPQEGRDVMDLACISDSVHVGHHCYIDFVNKIFVDYDCGSNQVYSFDTICNDLIYYHEDNHRCAGITKEVHAPWDPGKSAICSPPKTPAWGQAEFQEGRNVMDLACVSPSWAVVSSHRRWARPSRLARSPSYYIYAPGGNKQLIQLDHEPELLPPPPELLSSLP